MKIAGYIVAIGGLVGVIWTGINYINNSESFGFLGMDVAVSSGNITPVIISIVALLVGILIVRAAED